MVCPELPSAASPGSMAPAARQFQSLRDLGVDVRVSDMGGIPKLKYLQAMPRIRRMARDVDLIHAHFGYCGWLARCAPSRPLVMSFMGDDLLGTPCNAAGDLEWFSRVMVWMNRRLAGRVDAVIVKSDEMARVVTPVPSTVIPNGVDVEMFRPRKKEEVRHSLGWDSDDTYVLFPGDPANPRKGYQLASGTVEIASTALGKTVRLVPLWGVSPAEVSNYMCACDAMLMTSLIEGSPNVVKEAMACNLPVVAVRVGDVAEMLTGVEGYAVCERDPSLLARMLVKTLASGGEAHGRSALLRRGLDLTSVARRVIGVYERVLGRRIWVAEERRDDPGYTDGMDAIRSSGAIANRVLPTVMGD